VASRSTPDGVQGGKKDAELESDATGRNSTSIFWEAAVGRERLDGAHSAAERVRDLAYVLLESEEAIGIAQWDVSINAD